MNYINGQKYIKLPEISFPEEKSLFYALSERKTERKYDLSKNLSLQDLSNLIWAAYGPNRENEKKTAPLLWKPGLYLATAHGIYQHNNEEHTLNLINKEDIREIITSQDFVQTAHVNIILTIDTDDMTQHWVPYTGGKEFYIGNQLTYISQNIYLAAVGLGMATCAISWFNHDDVSQKLKLKDNNKAHLVHSVGYPL